MQQPVVAARSFRLDVKGAEVRHVLAQAGVRTVLLKGPAFARLLYDEPSARPYGDVDLLVSPARADAARDVLRGLGFVSPEHESIHGETDPSLGDAAPGLRSIHSETWGRLSDQLLVDLHHSLPHVGLAAEAVWEEVTRHLEVIDVGGSPTEVLDGPASALLVALHAAHHGPATALPLNDLDRAVARFELHCWRQARDLAERLDAISGMGAGLGLTAAGRELAQRLALETDPGAALELLWAGAPWSGAVVESFVGERSARRRLGLLGRLMVPSAGAMRRGSALARRGRGGLLAAYALRQLRLLRGLPRALASWRRFRRQKRP